MEICCSDFDADTLCVGLSGTYNKAPTASTTYTQNQAGVLFNDSDGSAEFHVDSYVEVIFSFPFTLIHPWTLTHRNVPPRFPTHPIPIPLALSPSNFGRTLHPLLLIT